MADAEEAKFLSSYRLDKYERPSVTADVAAFALSGNAEQKLWLLLIKRGKHPYKDHYALPGGFLQKGETVEECAYRELKEETELAPAALYPVGVFSTPGRDPRGWIISNAFVCTVDRESNHVHGGDDAAEAKWFEVTLNPNSDGTEELLLKNDLVSLGAVLKSDVEVFGRKRYKVTENRGLAFDHAEIIAEALAVLRNNRHEF